MSILNKPRCPYCGEKLEKKPARKTKCPHCSEFILIRKGELVTAKQKEDLNKKQRWLNWLEQFGASEKRYEHEHKKLSEQFGFEASVGDTLWRLMNSLLSEQVKMFKLVSLYLKMAGFLEDEGKDPAPMVEQAMSLQRRINQGEVRGFKRLMGEVENMRVVIHTSNDEVVCDPCREASSRTYSMDEFLEKMPIPDVCESKYGCRCSPNAKFAD